jgi:hypothetical protein
MDFRSGFGVTGDRVRLVPSIVENSRRHCGVPRCNADAFCVIVTPAAVRDLRLEPGKTVSLLIKASAFHRLL